MIYLDSCAAVKFIKRESETEALRAWRRELPEDMQLFTSDLAKLEITRTLLRAGYPVTTVPYYVNQALRGLYRLLVTTTVLDRAMAFETRQLGSLDSIHLASATQLDAELTGFVTYDRELAEAAGRLGVPVQSPA